MLQRLLTPTTWGWAARHRLRAQDSLTSDTSCKFGAPQTTLTFFQLSANLAVPNIPSGSVFIKTTHRTQGSAILTLLLQQKDTNEPAKGRDAKGEIWEVPHTKLASSSSHGVRMRYPSGTSPCDVRGALPTREAYLSLDVHRFLVGLHHVGMM